MPEWRYVPTKLNVADIATREDAPPLKLDSEWFQGPAFLRLPEASWPKDIGNDEKVTKDVIFERRTIHNLIMSATVDLSSCLPDEKRFSSWLRLLRATARVIMFIDRCRGRVVQFNMDLISRAEVLLLRKVQIDCFAIEMECVKQNKPLLKSSRLLKLTPYLDDRSILRLGGRIDRVVGVNEATCRPIIVDGRHKIIQLLVEHYHRRALHGSNEMVVNELRQRYWVIRLRPTVRGISARCLFCKHRRAAPQPQRMADLPQARLQHHRRPFSVTGVDFFWTDGGH